MSTSVVNLLSDGGFLESVRSNTFIFKDTKLDDITLYTDTPKQNIVFGTQHDIMSAMRITSNIVQFNQNIYTSNAFGLGTSNFLHYDTYHKFTIVAPSNSIAGPHMAIFQDDDEKYPIYQMRNWSHNDITQSYDSYWTGSNWNSSDSNANFRIMKFDGRFIFTSACNLAPGEMVDNYWRTAFMINSNSYIGIGNSNPDHRLTIRAEDSMPYGPHIAIYTDLDCNYPLYQMKNWTHNDITQSYDSYWQSNTWYSSESNANFRTMKFDGKLLFTSACNMLPGSVVDNDWRTAFMINSNSYIGIGYSNPTHRISVLAEDSTVLGPHMAFYTDTDCNNPVFQLRNWTHNDITQSYDSYWNSNNWISSDSNANFRTMKYDGRLLFTSACNMAPGAIVDSNWRTAFAINSNSFLGIGTSNFYNRVTMRAEDSTVLGPHLAIFTDLDSNYPLYQQRNWHHNDITQSYDSYWNSNNWISSDSNANFRTMKYNGRLLFTSACNMAPGAIVDSNWRTAFAINSNSFLGIGTSNFYNRVTMRAEDSTVLGPHLVMFTDLDSNHPLYQQRNWTHNDITQSYDSYWDSNNWISSDSNANFRTMKYDGRLLFTSACNMSPGSIVDNDWRTALAINSNSFLGIGTSNFYNRVTMRAEDSTVLGPHLVIFTDLDSNYPLYQQRNWTHNDITQSYDSYWDSNNWISSDSNANFRTMKKNGRFLFTSACNMTPGSIVDNDWRTAFAINSNSFLGIGTSNFYNRVTMRAEDSTVLGPHLVIFTDADPNYPLYQQRNWTHNDITQSYDSYWDSNNWISSHHTGNFKISKLNGQFTFQSACNMIAGSILDNVWRNAFTINSNSFIGIGTSNIYNRVTMRAEDSTVLGPHLAIFTDVDSNYPLYQMRNWTHNDITQSYDSYWDSNNWISSDSNANFRTMKKDGRLLFTSACNMIPGTIVDDDWRTAFAINSNSFLGIGTSNFYNRVTMRAEDSTVLGPHLVMFTDLDSNFPLYQQRNWTHNDITQSYDSYWDSNNWISSDSNANFRTMKYEGRLLFTSACNMTPGSIVDNDWRTAFAINSNSFLGIGTSNFYNRVTMRAEDSTVLGPHLAIFTDVDSNHPLYQQRNWTHNDITQSYDSYWNSNNWISSDSNANFRIMKKDGKLLLTSACNMTPGSIVDNNWRTAFMVNSNSFLGIGNSNPTHRVTMRAEDSTVLGPHMAFYTDIDQVNPLLQMRNWTHDDVAISFDSYWNSNNWASSSTSGNFQIYKQHGRLIFYSACNSAPTSNIDSSLFPALVINSSNSLIGIGMSNPTHRLTITGDANNVLGPHLAYYLTSDSNYPVFQQYNADHDNIAMSFDSFWNGSNWISSSTTGNFQIVKHNGRLLFQNATYQTVGDILDNSWFTALTINSNNYIGIRNSNPTHPLDVHGNVIFRSNVTYSAHAIPNSNSIYDLGTSNLRWRDLYLSGASVDMDSLALKKDYTTGGLIVFDKVANAVTRICVKELLVGDPTNLLNSNVFLMTASSNGLHFDNVTSNVPPQAYSQLNNLYVNATSIGLGNSNPEKSAQFFGDFEINPNIPRLVQWTNCIIQNDIDDLQGLASGTKIDYWGRLSNNQIGNPIYNKRGGYYDGPYIQCTYGSNYFTTSNTNLLISTNAGFTALAMVRFNRDITSNATIFEFSNSTEYIGLTRNATTNQLRFATDEIISTPLLSPSNIIYQNEWALYTVRYDALSNMVSLFKNINVTYSNDNSFVWNPIASNDSITISDKNFNSSNVSIGNANLDISYFYIFDRFVFNEELLDVARSILYNANASLKIRTDVQPYPPLEFYSDSLGWLPNGTRNGGQLYSKSYKHMMYGNGTYNIWANNENSPTDASYLAFNIQTDNNWSTSLTTFVSTVNSITPAILYIEIPNLIYVQAYTITASYLDATQSPSKWILYGSLDNSTWFDIDTIANENTWTVSETRVFYINSWSPAKFFKLEIFRNDSSPPNRISIETFQLYGNEINFQVDGSGIGVGTSLLKEKLTVEGSASISQCNIVGIFINDVKTNILTFPPNSISGSNVNLVNEKYGTGFYKTNQSSSNTGGDGFYAFDNLFSTSWASAQNKYNSSGVYTGAISSTLSGTSKTGEWLQISLPIKTRLHSYRITPRSSDSQITAPKGFYIGGSVDGTTWTQIDSQVKTWTSTASPSNFIVSTSSNLLFYNYYRIIVNTIGTGGAATTSAVIVDWKLFGETYTVPIANVGKSLTYGDSYTTNHVNIATNTLYDDALTLSLNADDINSSIISGGNVNIWGKLSQNDTSLQPIFYKTGGLKDLPFVRFSASNTSSSNGTYLIGGCGKLQINDNNGLTIVTMIKFTGDIFPNENIITYGSNLSSSNDVISFSRYGSGQQLAFTLYNSDSSASNSIQTGSSIFNQNEWNIFAARYTNSTNKLEIFKNNIEIAYTYGSTTLSNNMYNFSTVGGAANIDIGALYVWNSSISDSNLTQITDIMMQGYPQLFTDGSARLTKSVEGTLSVKSFNTYTNSVFRYPPIDLISNASSILNQTYGNGLYKVTNSSYYQSNDIYNGYNAFQTSSTTGWYGQASSYNVTTGNYTGSAVTMVGNIGSQIAYFGDWLQLDMPDSYLTLYYTILPRADYGTTAPVSWYFLGSTNGIDWNIIDTQTNYSFTSQTEITFDISANTTPYKYYRISIIKCKPTGGVVGVFRVSLYAKSRNTIMCQDDKVIVFDKLGIGLSNPASSLHVAGFSVLSGLKIIAGNASNVIVPLNPGGTGSGGGGSGGGGSGSNPVGYNTDSLGTIFGISGTTSAYSFRYVVGSSSNEVARLNGLGYFGLGTNNPTELLALSGGNVKLGSNLYVLNRLSIGKSNPQAGLDLATNAIFGSNITVADIGNYTQGTGLSNATKFAIITDPNRTGGLSWSNWAAQITHNGVNTSFSMASGRGVKIDTGSEFSVTQSPYSTDYLNCGALEVKNTEAGTLLYVRNDGKIGIGFSNATENLAIVGNMSLSNNGKVIFSTTNNKLGLNVAVPQYELDILGNINFTGNLYNNGIAFPVSRWQNNGQITYYMSNVGIGLSNAVEMLAVYSNMSLSNYGKIILSTSNNCLGFNVAIPTESLSIGCNLSLSNYGKVILATSNNFIGINNSNPTSILTIGGPTITFSNFGNTLLTASNNNLGINMINPTATLTIGGPTLDMSNFGNTLLTASNTNLGINNSTPSETLSIGGASISLSNYGKSIITASNSNIGINISDPTSTLTIGGPSLAFSNFGYATLFTSNSYLGVNCLNPQQSLCVGGNISLCNYGINSILYSSNGFLGINMPLPTETLSVGGTFSLSNFGKVVISTSNHFVGIGADPKASLSVVDTFSMSNFGLTILYASNTNLGVNVQNPSQSLTVGGSIGLVNTGTTVLNPYLKNLGINVTNPSENLAIGNSFSMSNEGTKVILIASNSSLGINNSKPTETLSIGGNFSLSNYGKSVLTASNDFIGINIPIPTSSLSIGGETITMSNYGITTFTASNNNLGINMIDPEETLSIAGSTFSMSNFGKTILYSSNGYLGIGQPIPTFTLDILGDVNVSGALYSGGASLIQWINADSNIYYGNGTVGIGTATPSTLLHVSGDVTTRNILPEASGTYDIGASNNTFRDLYLTGATIHLGDTKISKLNASNIAFQDSNYVLKTLVVNQIQLGQSNDPTDSNVYLIQKSAGGIVFTNITNGANNPTPTTLLANLYQNGLNFGLGVQNPNESLALLSNLSMSNYGKIVVFSSNSYLGIGISNPVAVMDVAGTGRISGNVGIGTLPGTQKLTVGGDITLCNLGAVILSTSNNYFGINTTKPTEILTVGGNIALSNFGTNFIATSNNFIGIGTSNPTHTLSVSGTIGFSNYGTDGFIGSSNNFIGIGTSNPTHTLTVGGNIGLSNYGTNFIATSNNFIGICTSNPTQTLTVGGNIGLSNYGTQFIATSNNYIGIGIHTPSQTLTVGGNIGLSNYGTNFIATSNNYIGIGTSNPTELLNVLGVKVDCNLYVLSNLCIGTSNPTQNLTVVGNMSLSNYGKIIITTSNSFLGIGISTPDQKLTIGGNFGLSNYGKQFIATSNNYIGIGTSNPDQALTVIGNIGLSNYGTQFIATSNNYIGIGTSNPDQALSIIGNIGLSNYGTQFIATSNNYIGIGTSNPDQALSIIGNMSLSNYGTQFIATSNNYIGIGTSNPDQALSIIGNMSLSNYGTQFIATSNNYIGIGTSNPDESLDVIRNAKIGCNLFVMSNVGIKNSNPLYSVDIIGDLNFTGVLRQGGAAYSGGQWFNNSTNVFLLGSNVGISTSTPSEAIDIKGSNMKVGCNLYVMSNIGIGLSNPKYALDVKGGINLTGSLFNYSNQIVFGSNASSLSNYLTSNNSPINPLNLFYAQTLVLTNGAGISSWNGFTQATTINQPIYSNNGGFCNLSFASFNSNNHTFLQSSANQTFNTATNGGFTLFTFMRVNTNATGTPNFFTASNNAQNFIIDLANTGQAWTFKILNGNIALNITTFNSITSSQWSTFTFRYDNSTGIATIYQDMNLIGSATATGTLTPSNVNLAKPILGSNVNLDITYLSVYDKFIPDSALSNMIAIAYNPTLWPTDICLLTSNVGIGTSNVTEALTVFGNIGLSNFGSQFIATSNNYFGIGTSNPTESLEAITNVKVGCNLYVMSNIGVGKSNPLYSMDITGDLNFTGTLRQGGTPYIGSQWSNNSTNVFLLGSNVGIGLSNPTQKLMIAGNIGFSNYGNSGFIGSSNNYIGIGTFNPTESLHIMSNLKVGCNLYVMSNIGIGKSNPAYAMDVTGDINFTGTFRQNGTPYIGSQWSNNSTTVFLLGSNVGISTSTPSEALDIKGSNMKVGCNLYVMSNVGIGTSNPQAQLHLSSNLRVDGALSVYSSIQFTGFELIPGQIQNNYTQLYASTSNIQGYSNMVYGASGSNGTMLSIMSNTSNDSFRFVSGTTSNDILTIYGNGNMTGKGQLMLPNTSGGKVFNFNKLISTSATLWYKLATVSDNKGSFNIKGTVSTVHDYHRIDVTVTTNNASTDIATNIIWNKIYYASALHLWGYLDFVVLADFTNGKTHLYMKVAPSQILGVNFDIMCQEKNQNSGATAVFYPNTFYTLAFAGPMTTVIDTSLASAANQYVVSTNANTKFVQLMDQNGYVGIGTSNPTQKLDVNGFINVFDSGVKTLYGGIGTEVSGQLINFGMNDASRFGSNNSSNQSGFIRVDCRATTPVIQFFTGGSNQASSMVMAISSNGYVGIGTTTPAYILDVNGSTHVKSGVNGFPVTSGTTQTALALRIRGGNNGIMDMGVNSASGGWIQSTDSTVLGSTYPLLLNPNGGAVGIGTTTPAYTLEINGNIGRSNNDLNFVTATDGKGFGFVAQVAGVQRYHMVIKNLAIYPADDNLIELGGGGVRWKTVYSANGTIQTSDELDKNHVPLTYGLSDLMKVSTIKYKWKSQDALPDDDPKKNYEYFGICARELNELFPELVYNEQEPYQINYSEIIPVCINAIKDLKKEKDDLLNIVNTLLTRIENLESKIM